MCTLIFQKKCFFDTPYWGLGFGIGDWDWICELEIEISNWNLGLGLEIGIRDWVLRIGIGYRDRGLGI